MTKKHEKILQRMFSDRIVRKAIVKRLPHVFADFYFQDHIHYDFAPFHREMFGFMSDQAHNLFVITGFRESAKSTLMSMFFPIWLVISGEARFILIISKTQAQAKLAMKNIKDELEQNELLRRDLGPFETSDDVWGASTITLSKYHAQIMVASRDQSIRGIKFRQFRPQLIVVDDIDDLESVKTQESRDDTWRWFHSTIIPLGTKTTRTVVLGTPLHEDSLIMRLKKAIEAGSRDGVYRSYPVIDEDGKPLWSAKFPTPDDLEKERRRIGDNTAWQREYLLLIVSEEDRLIRPEWLQYYKTMPARLGNPELYQTIVGVDLAATKEDHSDYTAMVAVSIFRDRDDRWSMYVHPDPINAKLFYPETRKKIIELSITLGSRIPFEVYIESVGYQVSIVQDLRHEGFPIREFKVHGQDKRQRLAIITHLIQEGIVLFPEVGAETLINQLVGFGTERHDDLADAFAIALNTAMGMMTTQQISFPRPPKIETKPPDPVLLENVAKAEAFMAEWKVIYQQRGITHEQWLRAHDVLFATKAGFSFEAAKDDFVRGIDLSKKIQEQAEKDRDAERIRWLEAFSKRDKTDDQNEAGSKEKLEEFEDPPEDQKPDDETTEAKN